MVTLLLLFTAYRISYSRHGCTAHLLWENRNKHSFSHFEERCRRTSQNNNSSYSEGLQLLPSVFHCKNNEGKVLVKLSIDGIAVQADYLKVLPFRHPVRHLAACCVDHNGSIPPASTSYAINITDEHNSVPVRQSNLDNVVPTAGIAMYVSTCSIFFDLRQHGMSSKPLSRSDGALRSTEGSVFSLRIHPKQIFLLWACAEKPAHDWPHQIEDEAYQQPAFLYMLQVTTTHSYRDTSVGTVWSAVNTRRNVCIDGASDFRGRSHRLNRDGGDSSHFHDCSRWAWQTIVTSLAGWASSTAQIVLWFFPPSRGMPLVSIKPLPSPYANSEDFSEAA